MLLETKSIVQFALLWGSTWSSASLAIVSVLVMALVSAFVASRVDIRRDEVSPRLEPILAVHLVERHPDRGHTGASLAQAHHGHPILEVLDAFGDEDSDAHPGERGRGRRVDGHRAGPLLWTIIVHPIEGRAPLLVSPFRC